MIGYNTKAKGHPACLQLVQSLRQGTSAACSK